MSANYAYLNLVGSSGSGAVQFARNQFLEHVDPVQITGWSYAAHRMDPQWQIRLRADRRDEARNLVRILELSKGLQRDVRIAATELNITQRDSNKRPRNVPQLREEVLNNLQAKAAALSPDGAANLLSDHTATEENQHIEWLRPHNSAKHLTADWDLACSPDTGEKVLKQIWKKNTAGDKRRTPNATFLRQELLLALTERAIQMRHLLCIVAPHTAGTNPLAAPNDTTHTQMSTQEHISCSKERCTAEGRILLKHFGRPITVPFGNPFFELSCAVNFKQLLDVATAEGIPSATNRMQNLTITDAATFVAQQRVERYWRDQQRVETISPNDIVETSTGEPLTSMKIFEKGLQAARTKLKQLGRQALRSLCKRLKFKRLQKTLQTDGAEVVQSIPGLTDNRLRENMLNHCNEELTKSEVQARRLLEENKEADQPADTDVDKEHDRFCSRWQCDWKAVSSILWSMTLRRTKNTGRCRAQLHELPAVADEAHADAPTRLEQLIRTWSKNLPYNTNGQDKGMDVKYKQYMYLLKKCGSPHKTENFAPTQRALESLPGWTVRNETRGRYEPSAELKDDGMLAPWHQQSIVSGPYVCRLCGGQFVDKQSFHKHICEHHVSIAMYRKRVIYLEEQNGIREIGFQEKRNMIHSFSEFQTTSRLGSGCNEWTEAPFGKTKKPKVVTPKPVHERREAACVVCAQLDWLEHRYPVALFCAQVVPNEECNSDNDSAATSGTSDDDGVEEKTKANPRPHLYMRAGVAYVQDLEGIDEWLNVERYAKQWPLIPQEELYASTVEHPLNHGFKWLLHTRRIHMNKCQPLLKRDHPMCAGVAKEKEVVLMCRDCRHDLCGRTAKLPKYALCNWNWIGREHVWYQNLSRAMQWMLSLGRPCIQQIRVGSGDPDFKEKANIGNTIFLAQPSAELSGMVMPPHPEFLMDVVTIAFAKDATHLENAYWAQVRREDYLKCINLRKQVNPVFQANVKVDESLAQTRLPVNGVPTALRNCLVKIDGVDKVCTQQVGPATRARDPCGPRHASEAMPEEIVSDDTDEGESEHESDNSGAQQPAAERSHPVEEPVMAFNPESDAPPVVQFRVLQEKIRQTEEAAAEINNREQTPRIEDEQGNLQCAEDIGGRLHLNQVIIDMQEVAKKLGRDGKQRLEGVIANSTATCSAQTMGLLLPTGQPLPQWDGRSWVACFVQWFFGDGTWNLERETPLLFEEWARMLQNREELEYHLPDDETAFGVQYRARPRSRFIDSEIIACMGDVQRRLGLLTGTRAAFSRQGFEKDVRLIAHATADEFQQAFGLLGPKAHLEGIMRHPKVPAPVKTAMRTLLLSSSNVPGTEGNKTMQRYEGYALTLWYGPAVLFKTFNYAEHYSPIMYTLDAGPAPGPGTGAMPYKLLKDEPDMPTLAEMTRIAVTNPRAQAKFFLHMEELSFRYICGFDELHIGRTHLAQQTDGREDDAAGSLQAGLVPVAAAAMAPGEHQGRGFMHAHAKLHSKVRGTTRRGLTEMMEMTDQQASDAGHRSREALLKAACTVQYDSSVTVANQLNIKVPPEIFTAKQQRQSRMDGGEEMNGTQREFLPVNEEEVKIHIAREKQAARAQNRRPLIASSAFKELSLKGAFQSQLPGWRRLCAFGRWYNRPKKESIEAAQLTTKDIPDDNAELGALPVTQAEDGSILHFNLPDGTKASAQTVLNEGLQWGRAYAHDVRLAQLNNHDHACTSTCVQYNKDKFAAKDSLRPDAVPNCRFWFVRIMTFSIASGGRLTRVRIRRRGKKLVKEPFVQDTDDHNEFGRAAVPRTLPFTSTTTDVGGCAARSNMDCQYLERAPPAPQDPPDAIETTTQQPGDTQDHGITTGDRGTQQKSKSVRQESWLYRSGAKRVVQSIIKQSMLATTKAIYRASHCCDFYITKYVAKPMQHVQPVLSQMANGMRRLEAEFLEEDRKIAEDICEEPTGKKPRTNAVIVQRARRTCMRLAASANRCFWLSPCEIMVTLLTGGNMFATHKTNKLFTKQVQFQLQECKRQMKGEGTVASPSEQQPINTLAITFSNECDFQPADAVSDVEGSAASLLLMLEEWRQECVQMIERITELMHPVCRRLLVRDDVIPTPRDLWSIATQIARSCPHCSHRTFNEEVMKNFEEFADTIDDEDISVAWNFFMMKTQDEIERRTAPKAPTMRVKSTNKTDDYAHRGPELQAMTLYIYVAYVFRIPSANLNQANVFPFERHYSLARTSMQMIRLRPTIPTIIGMKCATIKADIEGNALFKTILCTPWQCGGDGCCAKVTQFEHMCGTPAAMGSQRNTFAFAWKHRHGHMEVQAGRAEVKKHSARREVVLADTTLLRQYEPLSKDFQWNASKQYRATVQECLEASGFPLAIQHTIQAFLCSTHWAHVEVNWKGHCTCPEAEHETCQPMILRFHPEQLSLEEFVCHKLRDVLMNIDLAAEAAVKPLKVDADCTPITGEGTNDEIPIDDQAKIETCDIGGGGDDIDFVDDWDVSVVDCVPAYPVETAKETKAIAFRDATLQEARTKKRKSKIEKELLECAEVYGDWMAHSGAKWIEDQGIVTGDVTVPTSAKHKWGQDQRGLIFNRDIFAQHLLKQNIVKEQLKKHVGVLQPHEAQTTDAEEIIVTDDIAEVHPEWVDIPMAMKGPGAVAWHLLEKAKATEEQKDAVALLAWSLQKKFERRPDMASHHIDLMDHEDNHRAIWLGGGGVGKTYTLSMVVRPLFLLFYGPESYLVECMSNAGARHHKKYGRTMHAANGLLAFDSLKTPNLHLNAAARAKMDRLVVPLAGLAIDEIGQVSGELLHANALRFTYARASTYHVNTTWYRQLAQMFGAMSSLILCGDFLQLQPVPPDGSLISGLKGKSPEHKDGVAIFASIEHVIDFQQTQRFTDPLLKAFLAGMRTPGGQKVAPEARLAIERSRLRPGGERDGHNGRASQHDRNSIGDAVMFRETAYEWQMVSFALQVRTKAQAAKQQKILFYLQAVDRPAHPVHKDTYRAMMEEANMQKTKKCAGLLPLFIGQDVTLTKTWLPPFYVTGTPGKVVGIQPHPCEPAIIDANTGAPQRTSILSDGLVILRFQPLAVLVRITDSTDVFLEPTPCPIHAGQADSSCTLCDFHVGVIAVTPVTASWQYTAKANSHAAGSKDGLMTVRRTQVPLAPICASTLHQLQGQTAEPGLVAHLNFPSSLTKMGKWLAYYVAFSRPRSFDTLRIHGEPDWEVIESGPPEELLEPLNKMFEKKLEKTRKTCREARSALNWPANPDT